MSSSAEQRAVAVRYDGLRAEDLEQRLDVPKVMLFERIGSTLDVAHCVAPEGAPSGTLILADEQTAGRGRMGRSWRSEAGAGIWLTLVERPRDLAAISVLAVRIGLALASVLDADAEASVGLKWPNDLYVGRRKLGGILVEARWRDSLPEWTAIGVGINVRAPSEEPRAAGLRRGVDRLAILSRAVPAIRSAAAHTGLLQPREVEAFASRDIFSGRLCVEPVVGRVRGIDSSAALLVDVGSTIATVRAGSLVLEEEM